MTFIDPQTNVSLGHTRIIGLGDEKLWFCPTLGGHKLDLSGNGNHGTYNGGMGTVADNAKGGMRAYQFDGSDDDIAVTDSRSINIRMGLNAMSMSVWIYPNTISGGDTFSTTNPRYAFIKGDISPPDYFSYALRFLGGKPDVAWRGSTGFNAVRADSSEIVARAWQHVAVVHDTSSLEIYVNGVEVPSSNLVGSVTSPAVSNIKDLLIGSEADRRYFNGLIDDARIYQRAITQDEITHLSSKRGVLGTPRNPVIKKRRIFSIPQAFNSYWGNQATQIAGALQ